MSRSTCVGEQIAVDHEIEMPKITGIAVTQQFFEVPTALHSDSRRAEHRHQLWMSLRRNEHCTPFLQSHRHACLAEHVLSRSQGRNSHWRVQDGGRPVPDDIEIGSIGHVGPALRHLWNAKLSSDALRSLPARVADRDYLNVREGRQRR